MGAVWLEACTEEQGTPLGKENPASLSSLLLSLGDLSLVLPLCNVLTELS
jgi:hypothetical protein